MCPAPLSIVFSSAVTVLVGKTGVEYSWGNVGHRQVVMVKHTVPEPNVSDAEAWVYMMI